MVVLMVVVGEVVVVVVVEVWRWLEGAHVARYAEGR